MANVYIKRETEEALQKICERENLKYMELVNEILENHYKDGTIKHVVSEDTPLTIEKLLVIFLDKFDKKQRSRFLTLYDQILVDPKSRIKILGDACCSVE